MATPWEEQMTNLPTESLTKDVQERDFKITKQDETRDEDVTSIKQQFIKTEKTEEAHLKG